MRSLKTTKQQGKRIVIVMKICKIKNMRNPTALTKADEAENQSENEEGDPVQKR
jgi:hypothetical protein